jgi:mersacidin/lichenicidin family type 2 lantibiotic
MSQVDTIRTWKDEEYRLSLSEDRFRRRDMHALPAGDDQVLLVCDPGHQELVSRVVS